jgi:hypothetical protein
LEKRWGDQSWAVAGLSDSQTRQQTPQGTNGNTASKARENIEFDRAYLDFNVPFGKFQVGYMEWIQWGTDFQNSPVGNAAIRYYFTQGPFQVLAGIEKHAESVGMVAANIGQANDADKDVYDLGVTFKFAPGEAGLLYQFVRNSTTKMQQNNGYVTQMNVFSPYTKLTFGPFFVEAEGLLGTGTLRSYDSTSAVGTNPAATAGTPYATTNAQNVSMTAWGAFINAKVDIKPAYVGAQFVYLSGDDNSSPDKASGNINGVMLGNYGFNRTLILWNAEYIDTTGSIRGNTILGNANYANRRTGGLSTYALNQFMDNVWFYQIYAGFRPMPKMDLKAAFSYAKADKAPKSDVGAVGSAGYYSGAAVQEYVSDKYGYELDVTGTYKIYDNLTYMIGAGYLWTGDYFKGYDATATVKDNYILTHKLILNF